MSTKNRRDGNPPNGVFDMTEEELDQWFADSPPGIRRWLRYCLVPAAERVRPSLGGKTFEDLSFEEQLDLVYGAMADQCVAAAAGGN